MAHRFPQYKPILELSTFKKRLNIINDRRCGYLDKILLDTNDYIPRDDITNDFQEFIFDQVNFSSTPELMKEAIQKERHNLRFLQMLSGFGKTTTLTQISRLPCFKNPHYLYIYMTYNSAYPLQSYECSFSPTSFAFRLLFFYFYTEDFNPIKFFWDALESEFNNKSITIYVALELICQDWRELNGLTVNTTINVVIGIDDYQSINNATTGANELKILVSNLASYILNRRTGEPFILIPLFVGLDATLKEVRLSTKSSPCAPLSYDNCLKLGLNLSNKILKDSTVLLDPSFRLSCQRFSSVPKLLVSLINSKKKTPQFDWNYLFEKISSEYQFDISDTNIFGLLDAISYSIIGHAIVSIDFLLEFNCIYYQSDLTISIPYLIMYLITKSSNMADYSDFPLGLSNYDCFANSLRILCHFSYDSMFPFWKKFEIFSCAYLSLKINSNLITTFGNVCISKFIPLDIKGISIPLPQTLINDAKTLLRYLYLLLPILNLISFTYGVMILNNHLLTNFL